MSLYNFGAGGNIFVKLLQTTFRDAGAITRVQLLEAPPPKKKMGGAKERPNFGAVFGNFRI